jgi:hypothetical protein
MTIRRLSYAPGYSRSPAARARRKAQIEANTHIRIDTNDMAIRTRINVSETDKPLEINFNGAPVRPFEINFADGTTLSHAAGTKVIAITLGSQYLVTDGSNNQIPSQER